MIRHGVQTDTSPRIVPVFHGLIRRLDVTEPQRERTGQRLPYVRQVK